DQPAPHALQGARYIVHGGDRPGQVLAPLGRGLAQRHVVRHGYTSPNIMRLRTGAVEKIDYARTCSANGCRRVRELSRQRAEERGTAKPWSPGGNPFPEV